MIRIHGDPTPLIADAAARRKRLYAHAEKAFGKKKGRRVINRFIDAQLVRARQENPDLFLTHKT